MDPYNAAMVAVVKQHLGRYTGHPEWKEGKGVGGKQYSRLLRDFTRKFVSAPADLELDVVKVSVVKGVKIK